MSTEPIHIISLGAGVQSSTMSLMAACGEITPMPKCAIFADTQAEPASVYRWLDWLEKQLPFPVHRVTAGNLSKEVINKWGQSDIPAYFLEDGQIGIGKRQCTNHFKIIPVRSKCREMGDSAVLWHGISTDEISRVKDSGLKWLVHRWPLIEVNFTRWNCIRWMERKGFPCPPKSACVFCPYRSDAQWRETKKNEDEWKLCVNIDMLLNSRGEYLHRSCKPLSEVDFSTEEERGQLNMFNNECEGMCGV